MSPVSPKRPEVKNPVRTSPETMAAGTRTGLQMRKIGVATARPRREAARVRPERPRRLPPTGRRVATAMILPLDGPPAPPHWPALKPPS